MSTWNWRGIRACVLTGILVYLHSYILHALILLLKITFPSVYLPCSSSPLLFKGQILDIFLFPIFFLLKQKLSFTIYQFWFWWKKLKTFVYASSRLEIGCWKKKRERFFDLLFREELQLARQHLSPVFWAHSHAQLLSHSKKKILHCKSTLSRSFLASAKWWLSSFSLAHGTFFSFFLRKNVMNPPQL